MAKDDNKQKLMKATDALLKDRSITSITTKEITKAAGVLKCHRKVRHL